LPELDFDVGRDTICGIVRRWADVQPNAAALLSEGKSPLTYSALVVLIDEISTVLNGSGLGRGDRIGIVHSGGADMMSIVLGVMNCATPVPLNLKFSADELAFHIRNSGVTAIIVEKGLDSPIRTVAAELDIPCLEATRGDAPIAGQVSVRGLDGVEARPAERSINGDFALVISTSGTTTVGKVAPQGYRESISRLVSNMERFGIGPEDCCAILRPLYYSSGVFNCLGVLVSGGKCLIVPSFNAAEFCRALVPHQITWMSCGPAFLHAIHAAWNDVKQSTEGHRLRFLRSGTSRLDPAFADDLEQLLGAPIVESYGSTETGRMTCNPLPPRARKRGTVGIPYKTEIEIMAPDGSIVGPGVFGEIVARGDDVIDGYENDDEANKAAFIDGWFHTGDEGFFDEDGYLTLTGRIKEMINRGGEKVSPTEVDIALLRQPGVKEAVVFPIPHPTLGEEVAAAVVPEAGANLTPEALTVALLGDLTAFKVPRQFIFVDSIPKGETGKVQRYKLAETLGLKDAPYAQAGQQPTRAPTPLEARLQELWAKILKHSTVGLDENFFLLGGDSILAVELVLLVGRQLRCWLPAASLFEAGTVSAMARLIENGEPQGCMVPIQTAGDRPPLFCVHGARGQAIGFKDLARHLPHDQPLYGIQAIGWDGIVAPFTKRIDMAAYYVEEIRKVQPHGPYYISGYSFGGKVAVHMADILRSEGEEVALLVLFDSLSEVGHRHLKLGAWLAKLGESKQGKAKLIAHYAKGRLKHSFTVTYDWMRCRALFPIWDHYHATGKKLPLWLRRPDRVNRLMHAMYYPMPTYDGDAVYFKAEKSARSMSHPDRFQTWHLLIKGRLDVVPVTGGHSDFMHEPHIGLVGRELTSILNQAQTQTQAVAPDVVA
jgi:acyl-CoA synthetase (AMP-forming)/AMP-acid ligase II/thioesterase domain-containing protein/acyl carrier protein